MDKKLKDYFSVISEVTPPQFSEHDIKQKIKQEDARKTFTSIFTIVSLAFIMLLVTGIFSLLMFPTTFMLIISAIMTLIIPFSATGFICFSLYKKERVSVL